MHPLNNLQRSQSFSPSSSQVFGIEEPSKENSISHSKSNNELDLDLKKALSKIMNRPKFIEQIELKYSCKTFPTIKTEYSDHLNRIRENESTGVYFDKIIDTNNDPDQNILKMTSVGDLINSRQPNLYSNNYSLPFGGFESENFSPKNKVIQLLNNFEKPGKHSIRNNDAPNDNDQHQRKPSMKRKSIMQRLSYKFIAKKTFHQISPSVIKLIHDKAFGGYEDEQDQSRRNLLRSKPSLFMNIMKKHVNIKVSKQGSLRAILVRANYNNNDSYRVNLKRGTLTLCKESQVILAYMFSYKLGLLNTNLHQLIVATRELAGKLLIPIDPTGIFVLIWEAIIICLVFLDLFLLPFTFAFEEDLYNNIETFETIDTVQFSLYLLNIFVNFNTCYHGEDGHLISSRKKIIYYYLTGSFWIDIISSFPYRWTISQPEFQGEKASYKSFNFVKLLRFLRILRIFKVFRSNRILKKIEQHDYFSPLAASALNLLKLSSIITFLAHWCACCWYFIGITNASNSWLERANLEIESTEERYVASLYFAITTMLTVGYGDISPLNLRERIFGIFLMIIGGGTFGYAMTSIAEIIGSLEREESKRK